MPQELKPGDRFYYRHSISEEIKLWKVKATGPTSLIATNEHATLPFYYEQMVEPERHYCYIPK